ncbi:MAG TPA: APC family permease [Verrucomicrobiae bacterium]|jgi:amino acid transporter
MNENAQPHLVRRFGLLQATALNITNMIGIGPFITIPTMMATINGGGPQCMLGWIASLALVLLDGLFWAELSAAMPVAGGSYTWLREGFGRETWGRLMSFLFIWQFIISGPMEIGTGFIGVKQYLGYLLRGMRIGSFQLGEVTQAEMNIINIALTALLFWLLYRRIDSVGKITVWLWVGTMITVGGVIFGGATHFDPKIAFSFPSHAFDFSLGFLSGLGAATNIGIYDYLGYYDVCYIAEEVRDPGKVIPRSIMLSLLGVAVIYLTMNFSIIGVVPWRSFVTTPDAAIGSIFMEKIWGGTAAKIFTFLILWTAFGSIFTLALGYSRVPYAAAREGGFYRVFERLHPTKNFPHISLTLIIVLSISFSFFDLGTLISALLALRIVVQFMGQIGAVARLRRMRPDLPRPFRIWCYPVPALLALAGWGFIFVETGRQPKLIAAGALAAGVVAYLIWSAASGEWPFKRKPS